ncbi:MAG: hypothetical protein EOM50_01350 [Erysipelotrichia bacterium]|nr:hypothetical protein [Erysipelotrichia bacterium]NCC54815.1 hypothetical protein [Erysipelotrichia bacterium]
MKQQLIPKLDLTIKNNFNQAKSQSLKILSCNNDELRVYLNEQMNTNPYLNYTYAKQVDSDSFLAYDHTQANLYDEIMQQARLSKYHPDEQICEYLLLQLDSNGYFKVNYRELLANAPYPADRVKKHIAILRTFEPHGLFAFDLKECLQIQCKLSKHANSETAFLLCSHLEAIALQQYEKIIQKTQLSLEDIQAGIHFIQTLNPKPAANYSQETIYINPEFKITVDHNEIHIALLNDDLTIHFNAVEESEKSSELQAYMQSQRRQVQNIMNSIQKRNMTLLQIMQSICDIQKDFFLFNAPLHHLTLSMIAQNCNLHISTISRAIANKSFEFNNRYYPLKKMLCSGGKKEISAEEIKRKIKNIIDNENKQHPI